MTKTIDEIFRKLILPYGSVTPTEYKKKFSKQDNKKAKDLELIINNVLVDNMFPEEMSKIDEAKQALLKALLEALDKSRNEYEIRENIEALFKEGE